MAQCGSQGHVQMVVIMSSESSWSKHVYKMNTVPVTDIEIRSYMPRLKFTYRLINRWTDLKQNACENLMHSHMTNRTGNCNLNT